MQNAWLPEGICDEIEKKIRSFIWGCYHKHWANWQTVTKANKDGGLGIRTSREVSIALLDKHYWDLICEKSKLWTQILEAKYLKGNSILQF